MGLLFRSRRRRGPGLFGMLIVLGLLAAAAPFILNRSASMFTSCQNLMQSWGNTGGSVCRGLEQTLVALNDLTGMAVKSIGNVGASDGGDGVSGLQASLRERWDGLTQRLDSGANWKGGEAAPPSISMDSVREMMKGGSFQGFAGGGSSSDMLNNAFGSFMAAQSIGQSGEGDLDSQLAWYKNGAGMGEYGILSQLKLGSMYMGGGGGMVPDYGQAYDYNMQALGSLQKLQSSSSPEALTTLNALPVEPAKLQQQLQESLRQLQMKQ